nr:RimK/LysX family protein [Halorhodospira abdelmalekii]
MYVLGEIEPAQIDPPGVQLDARIDTGANTSSLDARNIEPFERDGEPWVRFEIVDPAREERFALERPRARVSRITQAAGAEERPVVELHVTVGEISELIELTLTDRSHLTHPLLIGRNLLRDVALVDVGLVRVTSPATPDDDDLEAVTADDYVEKLDPDAEESGDEEDDVGDDDDASNGEE